MELDQAMIVAGIGCRRGAAAADVERVIRGALARAGIAAASLDAIATLAAKQDEAGVKAAAAKMGLKVIAVSDAEIRSASDRVNTRSDRVLALMGVPSVAEAAALAAAGPASRLIGTRLVLGSATCALASSAHETPEALQ